MKVNEKLSILFFLSRKREIQPRASRQFTFESLLRKTLKSFPPANNALLPTGVMRGKTSLQNTPGKGG